MFVCPRLGLMSCFGIINLSEVPEDDTNSNNDDYRNNKVVPLSVRNFYDTANRKCNSTCLSIEGNLYYFWKYSKLSVP